MLIEQQRAARKRAGRLQKQARHGKLVRSTVTRNGQITIPVEIREALNLDEGTKVSFVLEGNEIRVARYGSVTQRTAGIFKHQGPVLSAEELREAAADAIAEGVAERSR